MHGAEFYASKRHKGEHSAPSDHVPHFVQENRHQRGSNLGPQHRMLAELPKLDNVAENLHNQQISSSESPKPAKAEADSSLPISDNNVSTTANDTIMDDNEWDNDADINVSTHQKDF